MAAELVKETKEYTVDSEEEAMGLVEKVKQDAISSGYDLINYNIKLKEKKAKGEVIDSWYEVSLKKRYTN